MRRKKILSVYTIVALFLGLIILVGSYLQVNNAIKKEIVRFATFNSRIITTYTDSLSVSLGPLVANNDIKGINKKLGEIDPSFGVYMIIVRDSNNEILTQIGNVDENRIKNVISEKELKKAFWENDKNMYFQRIYRKIHIGDLEFGDIDIVYNLAPLLHNRSNIINTIINDVLRNVTFIIVILALLQIKFIGPVNNLSKVIAQIVSSENFNTSVEVKTNDEIGRLATNFNIMMNMVNERDQHITLHKAKLEDEVRKRTIDLEKSREQALRLSKAKSDFLAVMSHEIRTPLNGILVMSELLHSEETDNQKSRFLDVILKSGRSLLMIINDILDSSKIDAGKMQLEHIDFNPSEQIENTINLFAEKAFSNNIEICFSGKNIPVSMRSDPTRFSQILNNIVSNSIKFTEAGGVIVNAETKENDFGKELVITITDTGTGIPYQLQKDIFKPFKQAEQSITRKYGGTGLGLSICHKLTKIMGGRISLKSKKDVGTSVKIYLPLDQPIFEEKQKYNNEVDYNVFISSKLVLTKQVVLKTLMEENIKVKELPTNLSDINQEINKEDLIICDVDMARDFANSYDARIISFAIIGDLSIKRMIDEKIISNFVQIPISENSSKLLVEQIYKNDFSLTHNSSKFETQEITFNGKKALIVDDTEINRSVMKESLTKIGVTSVFAENGLEAVERFQTMKFDFILMDCSMPVMDGLTATKEIRKLEENNGGYNIPIIAVSANAMIDSAYDWKGAGMDDYLTKPFTLSSLTNIIKKHVKADDVKSESKPNNFLDEDQSTDEYVDDYKSINIEEKMKQDNLSVHEKVEVSNDEANEIDDEPNTIFTNIEARKLPQENSNFHFIDLEIFEELSKIGSGKDFALGILKDFLETSEKYFVDFSETLKSGDLKKIPEKSHAFKSICRSSGALPLGAKLATIEKKALRGVLPDVSEINHVEEELEKTKMEINKLLLQHAKVENDDDSEIEKKVAS